MAVLLDCTLRDGGFYTNWYFEPYFVQEYIQAVDAAGIDFIEIGLRRPGLLGGKYGIHNNVSDDYIRQFAPKTSRFGVMVDAKDLTRSSTNPIFSMFCRQSESPVSLVRIATDVSDLPACEKLCGALKLLGYTVALNLMKFTELSVNELALGAASIEAWESVDVLYLADSFGNWSPDAVEETLRNIRSRWSKDIGVHAHDNRGYALINTVKAHVTEARWLDGTICGMGRGAGNARMEMLMQEVGYSPKYRPEALHSFAIDVVALMQAQHQWGPNPLYALSAQLGIHPSYTQEMLQENIPCDAIAAVLRALKREGGRSFDPRRLSEALHACQRTGT